MVFLPFFVEHLRTFDMERFELENSREFKAAMELENALNDMCFDYKKFAESIKYFHPTL